MRRPVRAKPKVLNGRDEAKRRIRDSSAMSRSDRARTGAERAAHSAKEEFPAGKRRERAPARLWRGASDFAERSSLSDVFGWYNIMPIGVSPAENMGAVKERND